MFKSLILTDFSATAKNAADFYFENLPQQDNLVMLFHNIDYPVGQVDASVSLEVLTEKAIEDLKAEKKRLSDKNAATKIDITYTAGRLSKTIEDIVNDFNIDLVIMGSPHKNTVVEMLSGTDVSKDVLKAVRCPVLVCPPDSKTQAIREAIVACNFNKELKKDKFAALADILENKKVSVDVLLIPSEEGFHQGSEKFFSEIFEKDKTSLTIVEHENDADQIAYFSEKRNADLVAFLPDEKDFFEKLFSENTQEKLIKNMDQPILIL